MLRALVLLLLLANAGFWAWRQGWLAPLHGVIGAAPDGERETDRLDRQVNPALLRLLPPDTPPARAPRGGIGAAPATEPSAARFGTACLEAGPYSTAELVLAEAALQAALPAGSWTLRELPPGRAWWVAMGPYRDTEALQEKREQLRRLALQPEPAASSPGGAPFLVLGRHDSRAAAEAALAALAAERSLQTARVLEGAPIPLRALRIEAADAAQQSQLAELPVERLRGRAFKPCGPTPSS